MPGNVLDKLRGLDPVNSETLKGFMRSCALRNLQDSSIENKVWRVYALLKDTGFVDAREIPKADLEDYIIRRRKAVSPRTLQGDIIELKIFFRYLDPVKEKEFFDFKMQRPKPSLPVDQILSRDDILRLSDATDTDRDRALVMALWDSGARISEALSMNIGHVEIDDYGAVIIVSGKTGERRLRMTSCVPDLQGWLEKRLAKGATPKSPLFVTYRSAGFTRLNVRTVQNLFDRLGEQTEIGKPCNPHAIRHARATDMARQGFTEAELRIIFGWSATSTMPSVYIHLAGADVEKKVLQKAGLAEPEPAPGSRTLDPVKCPRCKALSAPGSRYCEKCAMILDARFALLMMEQMKLTKDTLEYKDLERRVEKLERG